MVPCRRSAGVRHLFNAAKNASYRRITRSKLSTGRPIFPRSFMSPNLPPHRPGNTQPCTTLTHPSNILPDNVIIPGSRILPDSRRPFQGSQKTSHYFTMASYTSLPGLQAAKQRILNPPRIQVNGLFEAADYDHYVGSWACTMLKQVFASPK